MIILNNQPIITQEFPNKETKVKDFDALIQKENLLEFTYTCDGDLIELLFVKKRLDQDNVSCKLWINYMPYSRMDRKIEGDLFTLKYICEFINSLNFQTVYVVEPHSSITMELLNNSIAIYPALSWLPEVMQNLGFTKDDRIVFPDKGAATRYQDAGYQNYCVFDKTRNPQTGRIENMVLKKGDIPQGAKCIIVDDLCSAGGTFLKAAQILKQMGAGQIFLLVTHCEPRVFSSKLLEADSVIEKVFTSTSMINTEHPKIEYIHINPKSYV
ncbi:phosphoribosyltransferase family protein [Myroides sp. LJL116]